MSPKPRAVVWTGTTIRVIDQTALPSETRYLELQSVDDVVGAVRSLAVRGAPSLGVVGALGVAVAVRRAETDGWDDARLEREVERIRSARPTAVNLAWAVDRVAPCIPAGLQAVVDAALTLMEENEAAHIAIARHGADWITTRVRRRPVRVLTHCNTGVLATSATGTALGIVYALHSRGELGEVYVNETRPLLQGARLTAWELAAAGIAHFVQADAAAASVIMRDMVDVVIVGADRIAVNGDTANKIGTLGLALACKEMRVPFVVAAPCSTLDVATPTGDCIKVELRDPAEVLSFAGVRVAPHTSRGYNPAFDVTPARLITALITEDGASYPRSSNTEMVLPGSTPLV